MIPINRRQSKTQDETIFGAAFVSRSSKRFASLSAEPRNPPRMARATSSLTTPGAQT
jgi:hypothetical protein